MRGALCLLIFFTTLAASSPVQSTVVYTAGLADMVTRVGHYELAMATFDAGGHLVSSRNLTTLDAFAMGYVAVANDGKKVAFAAQTKMKTGALTDVELMEIEISATPATPRPAITDMAPLLAPCASPDPSINCTDASTFYGRYSNDGTQMLFSYRAWSGFGDGKGDQALGLRKADGTVTPLTYNLTENPNDMHVCPRFVPGSNDNQVLFMLDNGVNRSVAVHNIKTGVSTFLDLPPVAEFSGCPDFLETDDGAPTFFYIYQNSGWSVTEMVGVTLGDVSTDAIDYGVAYEKWFSVPLIAFGGSVDVLSFRFCSHVATKAGDNTTVACLTADDVVAAVDVKTGNIKTNYSVPLLPFQRKEDPEHRFCMTPDCYVIRS